MASSLIHCSHPAHWLVRTQSPTGQFICNLCRFMGSGLHYRCHQCNFDLHEHCANFPERIWHLAHPWHCLHLQPGMGSRICALCREPVEGFFYRCISCNFDVHPHCTNTQQTVHTEMHNYGPVMPNNNGPVMPNNNGPVMPNNYGPAMPINYGPTMPNNYGPSMPNNYGPAMPNNYGPSMPNNYGPYVPNNYGPAMPNNYGPAMPNYYGSAMPNNYGPAMPNYYRPAVPNNHHNNANTMNNNNNNTNNHFWQRFGAQLAAGTTANVLADIVENSFF